MRDPDWDDSAPSTGEIVVMRILEAAILAIVVSLLYYWLA